MSECPCGSKLSYSKCCEPLIKGVKPAETAEQLMRSRYSAYVKKELDYLFTTTLPSGREDYDHKATRRWAENPQWEGLDIIATQDGGPNDAKGTVEFIARFKNKNNPHAHHESAEFVKQGGLWYFSKGQIVPQKPVIRSAPKVGRNDPCPCGSGKNYKKCCGA